MIFRNILKKRFEEKNILECKEENHFRVESDSKLLKEDRYRFIVLQEYYELTEHVKNHLNIFHKPHAQLELLKPHNRISIKG